jgi:hypothetical protein
MAGCGARIAARAGDRSGSVRPDMRHRNEPGCGNSKPYTLQALHTPSLTHSKPYTLQALHTPSLAPSMLDAAIAGASLTSPCATIPPLRYGEVRTAQPLPRHGELCGGSNPLLLGNNEENRPLHSEQTTLHSNMLANALGPGLRRDEWRRGERLREGSLRILHYFLGTLKTC